MHSGSYTMCQLDRYVHHHITFAVCACMGCRNRVTEYPNAPPSNDVRTSYDLHTHATSHDSTTHQELNYDRNYSGFRGDYTPVVGLHPSARNSNRENLKSQQRRGVFTYLMNWIDYRIMIRLPRSKTMRINARNNTK